MYLSMYLSIYLLTSFLLISVQSQLIYHKGDASKDGKQKFMASAAEILERDRQVVITRNTTLLIDDDKSNIQIALDKGVRAIWFIPEEPEILLQQLCDLI